MLLDTFNYRSLSLSETLLDLAVRFIVNCPPEDVSSSERLFFQIEEAHWYYDDFARVENPELPGMKIRAFVSNLFVACPYLRTLSDDPISALLEFQNYKRGIPVRGAIILNEKLTKALLVKSWKGGSWSFPKGKINKNEPDDLCAVREVYEETGFDISPYLVKTDYIEVTREGKNIRLYVVRGVPESTVFETQTRKEISQISWHTLKKLPGFSGSKKESANTNHYFLTTPFTRGLEKYIAKAKGKIASLSSSESDALKNLLGVSSTTKPIENDEEAAKKLLSLLHSITPLESANAGTIGLATQTDFPASQVQPVDSTLQAGLASESIASSAQVEAPDEPSKISSQEPSTDRQILLNLLKLNPAPAANGSSLSDDIKSARQILDLLNEEMVTERALKEVAPVVPAGPPIKKPPVPPNWMLESLITSRKSSSRVKATSPNESSLLNILHPKPFHGLMSLLQPETTTSKEAAGSAIPSKISTKEKDRDKSASQSLLDLLGEANISDCLENSDECEAMDSSILSSLNSSNNRDDSPDRVLEPSSADINGAKDSNTSAASANLLALLGGNAVERAGSPKKESKLLEKSHKLTKGSKNAKGNSVRTSTPPTQERDEKEKEKEKESLDRHAKIDGNRPNDSDASQSLLKLLDTSSSNNGATGSTSQPVVTENHKTREKSPGSNVPAMLSLKSLLSRDDTEVTTQEKSDMPTQKDDDRSPSENSGINVPASLALRSLLSSQEAPQLSKDPVDSAAQTNLLINPSESPEGKAPASLALKSLLMPPDNTESCKESSKTTALTNKRDTPSEVPKVDVSASLALKGLLASPGTSGAPEVSYHNASQTAEQTAEQMAEDTSVTEQTAKEEHGIELSTKVNHSANNHLLALLRPEKTETEFKRTETNNDGNQKENAVKGASSPAVSIEDPSFNKSDVNCSPGGKLLDLLQASDAKTNKVSEQLTESLRPSNKEPDSAKQDKPSNSLLDLLRVTK